MIEDKTRSLIAATLQLSIDNDDVACQKFVKDLFNC